MNAGQPNNCDAEQPSQGSPFVDPDHLSLQLAQKLAEPTTVEYIPPPRFSIAHLFLWTTFSAVTMAIGRTFIGRLNMIEAEDSRMTALLTTYWCVTSAVYGLQATGLWVEVSRRRKHGRLSLQPGEWLLVAFGTINVAWIAAVGLYRLVLDGYDSFALVLGMLFLLVGLVMLLVAAVKVKAWNAWRWILLSSLVVPVFRYFIFVDDGTYVFYAIQAALWLTAVVRDRPQWHERNWLHWTGAFTFIVLLVFEVARDVAWRVMMHNLVF
jgi:hypothetical protein